MADWLETWVESRLRLRDSTRRIYRSHIRLHFRRIFDGVLLAELNVARLHRSRYYIYRVTSTDTATPTITRAADPLGLVLEARLTCTSRMRA